MSDTTTLPTTRDTGFLAGIAKPLTDVIQWMMYPNPTTGLFQVLYKGDLGTGSAICRILDISGREVKTVTISVQTGTPVLLDLTGITSGLYTLDIHSSTSHFPILIQE